METIFDDELSICKRSEDVLNDEKIGFEKFRNEYIFLKAKYDRLLDHTKKLVKTSDSIQKKIRNVQKELEEQSVKINRKNHELNPNYS